MKADLCHVDREKKQRKKQSSLLCIKNINKLVHRRIKKKKKKDAIHILNREIILFLYFFYKCE
jgi:hypothetical protein